MERCDHKKVLSMFLAETDDHVTLCLDCRSVIHWCNATEDEWRDHEKSRTQQNTSYRLNNLPNGR